MNSRNHTPVTLRLLPPLPPHEMIEVVEGLGAPPASLNARAKRYFMADGPRLVASGLLLECDRFLFTDFCRLRVEVAQFDEAIVELEKKPRITARQTIQLENLRAARKAEIRSLNRCAASMLIDVATCSPV